MNAARSVFLATGATWILLAACRHASPYDLNYALAVGFDTTARPRVDRIVAYYDRDDKTQGQDLEKLPRVIDLSAKPDIDALLSALRESVDVPNVSVEKATPTLYFVAHDNAKNVSGLVRYAVVAHADGLIGLVLPGGGGAVRKNRAVLTWLERANADVYRDCQRRAHSNH